MIVSTAVGSGPATISDPCQLERLLCLKRHYADHLVDTNDNVADILSVISVMIGKQHHVLVLQEKGPYKNP